MLPVGLPSLAASRNHLSASSIGLFDDKPFIISSLHITLGNFFFLMTFFDDIFAIKENMDIHPETLLLKILSNHFRGKPKWSNTSHKLHRPLCVLTFHRNFMIHGLKPFGYHVVNVVLHRLVCLLYTCVCKVVAFKSSIFAFLVGILFATHLVHTEAVSSGRATLSQPSNF